MPSLDVAADELENKRIEISHRLNNQVYNLKPYIRKYEESTGKNGRASYDAVIDAFTHQAAVYELLLRALRGDAKFSQSNVYSIYVCSVYGAEKFSGLEERTLKTKGFFDDCTIDLTTTTPPPSSKFMEVYSEAVKMCANSGDFDLDSITSQYFQWMYSETQRYREDKFMLELQMALNRSPLVIKEKDGTERKFSKITRALAATEGDVYSWDRIGGYEEEKRVCQEIEHTIRNLQFMRRRMRNPISRGIIFYGPPGTGKTTFAKTIATQAGVPFEYISREDVADTFKDGTPQKLREIYARSKSYITKGVSSASVVILDEADSMLAKRDGREREHSNEVSVVLTEMDGNHVPGLITLAATNRKDILDPAVLRPGRFEMSVHIGLPDTGTREVIYRVVLKEHADYALQYNSEENFLGEIDYRSLAKATEGLAGAHIRGSVERAVRNQSLDFVMRSKQILPLTTEDILRALKEIRKEEEEAKEE